MVNGFLEVFPNDFPIVPSDWKIMIGIDLVWDASPIYIPRYKMASTYLKDLKEQLKDHLDEAFVYPIVFPWEMHHCILS